MSEEKVSINNRYRDFIIFSKESEDTYSVESIDIKGQKIFLSHYAHLVWDKSHKDVIHLFGHSHGTLKGVGRSMDVGVDTNNLYPYSIDEILEIMKKKKVEYIDHHTNLTT